MKRRKIIRLIVLIVFAFLSVGYIIFMCYESEPKFENNLYGNPVVGDYVDIVLADNYGSASDKNMNGLVIQTDSTSFSIQFNSWVGDYRNSGVYSFAYTGTAFKILGKGTFYHKANQYVGFNIMAITIWINVILAIIILRSATLIIYQLIE